MTPGQASQTLRRLCPYLAGPRVTATHSNLSRLLATLEPVRVPGIFAYVTLPAGHDCPPAGAIATLREPEGWSAILPAGMAAARGLAPTMLCGWITLRLHSPLNAVGLTAAFASALAKRDIPCNVVAGTRHDHLFVPIFRVYSAMDALRSLQKDSAERHIA